MPDNFFQRKNDVLSKIDKSFIGDWDEKAKSFCDKINSKDNFYTTSSCSGRVVLMIEQEKKSPNLFLKVWHEEISFENLKKEFYSLIPSSPTLRLRQNALASRRENSKIENKREKIQQRIIKFKLEQPIFHIACRDLDSASELLEKAKHVGFKRSGINTFGKNILLELNSTEKLEFPIIKDSKILVDDGFLRLVVELSNEKLKKGWVKIKKLEKLI